MGQIRVLLTALGGDLAQSVLKALRYSQLPIHFLGADCAKNTSASLFADEIHVLPSATAPNYINELRALIEKKRIDLVIPCNEAEIFCIADFIDKHSEFFPCPVLTQPFAAIEVHRDKLKSYTSLSSFVQVPPFADVSQPNNLKNFIDEFGLPCVIKGRFSSGSKQICVARNEEEALSMAQQLPNPVAQAYLDDSGGEFSVGIYIRGKECRGIVFRRTLGPVGASWFAQTAPEEEDVLACAIAIAKASGLQGSFNLQLRKGSSGIGLLEINPRFSSLVAARAAAGFCDAAWAVQDALGIASHLPTEFKNVRFQRFFQEAIDFGDGYACIKAWQPKLH